MSRRSDVQIQAYGPRTPEVATASDDVRAGLGLKRRESTPAQSSSEHDFTHLSEACPRMRERTSYCSGLAEPDLVPRGSRDLTPLHRPRYPDATRAGRADDNQIALEDGCLGIGSGLGHALKTSIDAYLYSALADSPKLQKHQVCYRKDEVHENETKGSSAQALSYIHKEFARIYLKTDEDLAGWIGWLLERKTANGEPSISKASQPGYCSGV